MDKIRLVFIYEWKRVILRRSFILVLLLVPLGTMALYAFAASQQKPGEQPLSLDQLLVPVETRVSEGFVDASGLITTIPPDGLDNLTPYTSQSAADAALRRKEITSYYYVPADYLKTGEIINVRLSYNPMASALQSSSFMRLLNYNLAKDNPQVAERMARPLEKLQATYLSSEPARDPGKVFTVLLPYMVAILFYSLIIGSASLLTTSLNDERNNRVLEVLLTSIRPLQLLIGKVLALASIGMLQTILWSSVGLLTLRMAGQNLQLDAAFQLPVSIFGWGILFFLLGYLLYASLISALGAMVDNLRDTPVLSFVLFLPMMVPVILISVLTQSPNGWLAVFLSLFPLTAPVTIMMRLATAANVPLWQILASIGLLAVSVAASMALTARFFRAQNLLAGQKFEFKRFWKALRTNI